MDKQYITNILLSEGVTKEEIDSINLDSILALVENASSLDNLCENLKIEYPDFDENNFRNLITSRTKKEEEIEDLSDDDLEAVAGGSNWASKNKNMLILIGLVATACVAAPFVKKGIDKLHNMQETAKIKKYEEEINALNKQLGYS